MGPCRGLLAGAVCALATLIPVAAALANGSLPQRLAGHGGPVKGIAVAPDGLRAATASFDYSIIVWSLSGADGTAVHRMTGHNAAVNDVAWTPDGRTLVSASDDGAVGFWDTTTGTLLGLVEGTGDKVVDVAVSLDGRLAAAARWDGKALLFDTAARTVMAELDDHRGNVNSVSFSLDGTRLFTASYDGVIRAYDIGKADPDPETVYSHGWGVNVVQPLPGGSQIVFGALDGTLGAVDLTTGALTELAKGEHPILSLAVSQREGVLAAGSADGYIRLFDADTGALADEFHEGFGPVWSLGFTLDGKNLYRAGLDDFAILWQFEPRKPFEAVQSVFPRRFSARDVEDPGELEFLRKCSVCHTLTPDDANRAGPTLYGIFGRRVGTVENYDYSDALKNADIVWNAETIGQLFSDGPDVMTPGTKMPVQRLKSVERRDALIDYLARATKPDGVTAPPGIMEQ